MSTVLKKVETQIVEFSEFESRLADFKDRYEGVVYDLTDPAQDKQARSDRFAIAKVISALDERHKEIKAPLKVRTDLIDGERKRIKDQLLDVQGSIKSQIDAHEAKIQAAKDEMQARVQAIYALAEFGEFERPTAEQIGDRGLRLRAIEIDESFGEMQAEAALAKISTDKKLQHLHAEQIQREEEQSELDRLRKETEARERADREERIRKEAAEKAQKDAEAKARLEAERVEREKKEAAERAERERLEAEEKAAKAIKEAEDRAALAAKNERERIEREQKAAAEKAEAERKADEAKKAKQEHRSKIHKQAKDSLTANGIEEKMATKIVELIRDGEIKNVTITY